MTVDTSLYIGSLNTGIPTTADPKVEGPANFQQFKTAAKNTLPNCTGAVTATHTELSHVAGVTAPIQDQLDDKGEIAGQTWTGAHDFTGAAIVVPTPSVITHATPKSYVDSLVISATAPSYSPSTTAVSKTLVAFESCAVTASGQTISLPASPTAGLTVCRIRTRSGVTTTIGRNGLKIQGLSEDMTVPYGGVTVTLGYQDTTDGWILL